MLTCNNISPGTDTVSISSVLSASRTDLCVMWVYCFSKCVCVSFNVNTNFNCIHSCQRFVPIHYLLLIEINDFTESYIKVLSILLSTVKFDDCMGNKAVVFQSSDPLFSVRTDGSIYAKGEGARLDEPVQFKLTANGPHTHVWETVVQLALIEPPLPQLTENEVSYT